MIAFNRVGKPAGDRLTQIETLNIEHQGHDVQDVEH